MPSFGRGILALKLDLDESCPNCGYKPESYQDPFIAKKECPRCGFLLPGHPLLEKRARIRERKARSKNQREPRVVYHPLQRIDLREWVPLITFLKPVFIGFTILVVLIGGVTNLYVPTYEITYQATVIAQTDRCQDTGFRGTALILYIANTGKKAIRAFPFRVECQKYCSGVYQGELSLQSGERKTLILAPSGQMQFHLPPRPCIFDAQGRVVGFGGSGPSLGEIADHIQLSFPDPGEVTLTKGEPSRLLRRFYLFFQNFFLPW